MNWVRPRIAYFNLGYSQFVNVFFLVRYWGFYPKDSWLFSFLIHSPWLIASLHEKSSLRDQVVGFFHCCWVLFFLYNIQNFWEQLPNCISLPHLPSDCNFFLIRIFFMSAKNQNTVSNVSNIFIKNFMKKYCLKDLNFDLAQEEIAFSSESQSFFEIPYLFKLRLALNRSCPLIHFDIKRPLKATKFFQTL